MGTPYHAQSVEETLTSLEVDPARGLAQSEVSSRRERFGSNVVEKRGGRSVLRIFFAQFRSVVVVILCAAAVLAFVSGRTPEAVAILAVVVVNVGIGFVSEWRAARSMAALQKMGRRNVRVRREGGESEVTLDELVPGDICLHESGDMAAADLRLVEANNLRVDESALTGESVPVPKTTAAVEEDTELAERTDMLYRGTTIAEGSACGVVVATGMGTELGRIAELAETEEDAGHTPLERSLNRLGQRLAWVSLGVAALIGVVGWLTGKSTTLMVETAIALGVAAVPEGLPFAATLALARGMWLLARMQALIKRLPAVETLGATDLILVDKTGTLTENRMTVAVVATEAGEHDLSESGDQATSAQDAGRDAEPDEDLRQAMEIGVLCNNATVTDADGDGVFEERQGDPTEVALLLAGVRAGLDRKALLEEKPEEREAAFDPDVMMMATVHAAEDAFEVAVKGAPEAVLETCSRVRKGTEEARDLDDAARRSWMERADALAERGLRTLALARKRVDTADAEPYEDLALDALVGLRDPPREGVDQAIRDCHRAGIRVVMVTGDKSETARAVAAELGLVEDSHQSVITGRDLPDLEELDEAERERLLASAVFARVSPEQKLRILELFQDAGHTVAMTGDGVNDAPALQKADIGIAMGRRGTDAARETSDVVLKNDAFQTILRVVEQGRIIFGNIRKAVVFLLCTNGAEVLAVAAASALGAPLPLRPLQILFLNVVTDVFPALALSVGRGRPEAVLSSPPRRADEPVLRRREWLAIAGWSTVIAVCVLGALLIGIRGLGLGVREAVTVSFLTLAFGKLWFVANLREPSSTLFDNDVIRNPWIWASLGLCCILLCGAVYVPFLSRILDTSAPGLTGWLLILAGSLVPAVAGNLWISARGRFHAQNSTREA